MPTCFLAPSLLSVSIQKEGDAFFFFIRAVLLLFVFCYYYCSHLSETAVYIYMLPSYVMLAISEQTIASLLTRDMYPNNMLIMTKSR